MSNVAVCEEDTDKFDIKRFNIAEYVKQTFGMFSGKMVNATLRFNESLINVILDRSERTFSFEKITIALR